MKRLDGKVCFITGGVEALRVVREEKRCAVLDVWLPHL